MFRTTKDVLNEKDIMTLISKHEEETKRLIMLKDYYLGKHKILKNEDKKNSAPDNRLVHPYPKYITDMLTGYFVGQPVLYSATDRNSDEDDKLLEILLNIFRLNGEQEENLEIAKMCSITGKAYELLWVDEDSNVRFDFIDPTEAFIVYDHTLEKKEKFAIRHYSFEDVDEEIKRVEFYTKDKIFYYTQIDGKLVLDEEKDHYFKEVPVILYENNKEQRGDFEPVLSLIDAYDLAQSNTLNDLEQFTDAYLVLVNMFGTEDEDIKKLQEDRVLLLDDNGEAKWLIKDVNDMWVENYKTRTKNDLHKFSFTPDMTDENFGGNLSGVSLGFKLLTMEQLRAIKEQKFRQALQRRIQLITNFLQITNREIAYTGIGMQFNNTLPTNILERAQIVNMLSNYLPIETLIEQLPFVENAKEEIDKKRAEEEEGAFLDYKELEKLLPPLEQDDEE